MAKNKPPAAATAAPVPQTEKPNEKEPARPAIRRDGTEDDAPIIARKVFILCHSTGERAALADVPLHEIPLLRRKIPALGGNDLKLLGEWPANAERIRSMTAPMLREEYEALRDRYTYDKPNGREGEQVDLMMDVYGPPHQGRLVAVMRRLEAAWKKLVASLEEGQVPNEDQLNALVELAEPEHDFDSIPFDAITAEA